MNEKFEKKLLAGTRYWLIDHLSAGGYGTVYRAEHDFTGALVAVKVLQASLVNSDAARRMRIEAQTLAKLAHRNIVMVLDGGLTTEERPRPFIVMELLKGASLEEVLQRKPAGLQVRVVLKLGIHALEGLEAAHAIGIVHRDLKPANIFLHLTPSGETITKVLDFGVAHLLQERRNTGEMFLGTFRWAAPEQFTNQRPTAQTDLYSMGMVLYRCLCGRGPFDGVVDEAAIGRAHLLETPPALSAFVSGIPEDLEALVMQMLSKAPAGRPQSAAEVAARLWTMLHRLDDSSLASVHSETVDVSPEPLRMALRNEVDFTQVYLPSETAKMRVVPVTAPLMPRPLLGTEVTRRSNGDVDRYARTSTARPILLPAPMNDTDPLMLTGPAAGKIYIDPDALFFVTPPSEIEHLSFSEIHVVVPARRRHFLLGMTIAVLVLVGIVGVIGAFSALQHHPLMLKTVARTIMKASLQSK
jgi:serine/threonine protein kinase